MDAGSPAAGADTLRELLQLYRDRDARDQKIRQLEQALADTRRVTPGGNLEDAAKLTLQVEKLQETISTQGKQLEELRGIKEAHDATIATLRVTLDDSYSTIGELKQSKASLELQMEQISERNASLVATTDQLRLQNSSHEVTIADLRKHIAMLTTESNESRRARPRESTSLPTPIMSEAGSTAIDGEENDSERASLKAHIVDLSMKLHKASSEIVTLQDRLTSHQEENGSLQARIKELEDEKGVETHNISPERLSALEDVIEQMNVHVAAVQQSLHQAIAERDSAQAESLNELHQLQGQLESSNEQLANSLAQQAQLAHERDTLEADHAAKISELERLRSTLGVVEEAQIQSRSEATQAIARNSALCDDVARLEEDNQRLMRENHSLSTVLAESQDELKRTNESYAGEIKNKDAEIVAGLSLSAALESELASVREELSQLAATRESLEVSEGRVQALENETERLRSFVTDIGNQLSAARQRNLVLEPLEDQLVHSQERLQAAEQRIEDLDKQLIAVAGETLSVNALQERIEDLQAKLSSAKERVETLEGQLHSAQTSVHAKEVELEKIQAAHTSMEKRVDELTAHLKVATASNSPATSDAASAPATPARNDDPRSVIKDLQHKLSLLEAEKVVLLRNAQVLAPVVSGTESIRTDCSMRHTVQDILSSLTRETAPKDVPVEHKHNACRIWVTNMFEASHSAELPQSEVFLQYHSDLALSNKPLRLPAVEFFKVCQSVYPNVVIEHRSNSVTNETHYVVTGMARRQVRTLPVPVGQQEPKSAPLTPITLEVKKEDKSPEKLSKYNNQGVQVEAPVPSHALQPYRKKPWNADSHLDFKIWLRHAVLGLSDAECIRPIARTPVDSLRRYVFVKRAQDTIVGLGWSVPDRKDVTYRVPPTASAYCNAEFTQVSLLEAAGVAPNVWDADNATFYVGAEHVPRLQAWVKNPDDPSLLELFGSMSREQLTRYKSDAARKRSRAESDEGSSSPKKRKSDEDATI